MATSDDPPIGAPPVPSTYPDPVANNVNMHPIPWPLDQEYAQDTKSQTGE